MSSDHRNSAVFCIVCCEEIDGEQRLFSIGNCNHIGCCSICSLRMRQLFDNYACVLCKVELPRVITTQTSDKLYEHFSDWGEDNIGPNHAYDEPSKMFILQSHQPQIAALRNLYCAKCPDRPFFSSYKELETHYHKTHQLSFCSLCLTHKKVFIQEQNLFTQNCLQTHLATNKGKKSKQNAVEDGFEGHPKCDFCNKRFYSSVELYEHVRHHHFECDICLRALHIENRYYRDYRDLERHFRAEHFLCEEKNCLEKKFVVFRDQIEYHAHMALEHPHRRINKKLDIHFNIRRANDRDSHRNERITSPQANVQRSENVINVADFPSLSGVTTQPTSALWAAPPAPVSREDEYPALPSGGAVFGNANTRAFRNAIVPPPTAAMAAHTDNSDPWRYAEMSAAAEALGANNPLLRLVRPSKSKHRRKVANPSPGNAQKPPNVQIKSEHEETAQEESKTNASKPCKSAIVLRIAQILGSQDKYEEFRELCQQFRASTINIANFYGQARSMFTEADFDDLVCQFVEFFPQSEPKQTFFRYHRQQKEGPRHIKPNDKAKAKPTRNASQGWAASVRQMKTAGPGANANVRTVIASQPARSVGNVTTNRISSASTVRQAKTPTPARDTDFAPPANVAPRVPNAPVNQTRSYRSSTNTADFPALPAPAQPIGRVPVTRAMWGDHPQQTADEPLSQSVPKTKQRRQKKKSMTLAEMAMKFQ